MVRLLFVAFTVCVFLSNDANAQSLWGGTFYGMTLDGVKKAVPNVTACDDAGNRLGNGALGLLCKTNISVVRELFKASFYFKDGGLTQVTLSLQGTHNFNDVRLVFDSLADVLRSKYGHELSLKSQTGTLNRATADWMSGRTNINLFALSVYDAPATLNVNYQVRVSQDADKL